MPKINSIMSEFEKIYRVILSDGAVIEIYEVDPPKIGSELEYCFSSVSNYGNSWTEMNGTTFSVTNSGSYVSFGGLLAFFPRELDKSVTMVYTLK